MAAQTSRRLLAWTLTVALAEGVGRRRPSFTPHARALSLHGGVKRRAAGNVCHTYQTRAVGAANISRAAAKPPGDAPRSRWRHRASCGITGHRVASHARGAALGPGCGDQGASGCYRSAGVVRSTRHTRRPLATSVADTQHRQLRRCEGAAVWAVRSHGRSSRVGDTPCERGTLGNGGLGVGCHTCRACATGN